MVLDVNKMGLDLYLKLFPVIHKKGSHGKCMLQDFLALCCSLSCSPLKGLLRLHVLECEAHIQKKLFIFEGSK